MWHYPRKDFASFILEGMKSNLLTRVTIFAPRKSGKTEFALQDVKPLAKEQGMLVIYVDFWKNKSDPEQVFIESVLEGVKESKAWTGKLKESLGVDIQVGLDGIKLGLGDKGKEIKQRTISQTFELLNSVKPDVLLLLDEVQHLATDKSFENFTAALRSFMVNRADNKIKGIFTGSSQEGLSRLFNETRAPFYDSSQVIPFKPLDEQFVVYQLGVFKKVTNGKTLDEKKSIKVFDSINRAPGRFVELLKQMALNTVYDIEHGCEIFAPQIMDAELRAHHELAASLTGTDKAVLAMLIKTGGKGIYTDEFKSQLSEMLGKRATKSTIQNAIQKLVELDVIFSLKRGTWTISDPSFAKYIISLPQS
jgi:hypothetical protein